MTNESIKPSPKSGEETPGFLSKWLNYRGFRFWAIVLIVGYTLAGFFLVPVLLKNAIVDTAAERLGRSVSIEKIESNPYVLSILIHGFELEDRDGAALLSFDEFFVNFQLSSLFNWAWTFDEIRLDGLKVFLERFNEEENRLSSVLEDFEKSAEPQTESGSEPAPVENSGIPRLLVHNIALNRGSARLLDHVPAKPVEVNAGPVTVAIEQLNTLPDRTGQQSVTIAFPDGAAINWSGSINLEPLHSEGEFALENARLDQAAEYLKDIMPVESLQAVLSLTTSYSLAGTADGAVQIELHDIDSDISSFALTGLQPGTQILQFPGLAVRGGSIRYPDQTVHFDSVLLDQPVLDTWLDAAGEPNLLALVPEDTADDGTAAEPWSLTLNEFRISEGIVDFSDRGMDPATALRLQDIEFKLENISNQAGASMPLTLSTGLQGGGQLDFGGQVVVLPDLTLTGNASAVNIPLLPAQPYIEQQLAVAIEQGSLSLRAELEAGPGDVLKAGGELTVSDFKIRDTGQNESLAAWQRLDIDRFEADVAAGELNVSSLSFKQPYGRIEVKADRTTNLDGLMIPSDGESLPEDPGQAMAWHAVIGGIGIDDGSMDFADRSLPLPFSTRVTGLDGTISTIDSASTEPANIRLEGQVDEYGLARIDGGLNVFDPVGNTDITLEFRNLLMSNLSPYSVEFAGREIDEGKLDLDLEYVIKEGRLAGSNDIVLSDLLLGDEVDSPNAVSLPLGLAVALLKDSEGVIDIELPVEGDINDPEFKIGGVIWQAFTGLITKIVSAPFRLLGNLVGIDSEDFGQFQFLAGRADLTPPELEKIAKLTEALQQRPEIEMEISGVYDPGVDTPALKYFRLRDLVFSRIEDAEPSDGEIEMLDEDIRDTLEAIYLERFPGSNLDDLKALHVHAPADDPEGKPELDPLAYAAELRDRLLESEPVTAQDLADLAGQRARVVQEAFLAAGALDPGRIVIADPSEVESEDGEWLVMELGVAAD